MKKNSVRLSPHVVPTRYKITMKPDLAKFSFTGKVEVSLQIAKPTKKLVLHAADLKVHYAVWSQGKNKIEAASITYQKKEETVTFSFPKALSGTGKLITEFEGELNESLRGFYRSSYNHKGQQKHIATTQFEATDARRAFPNFDEPAHKAIFDVSLIVPEKLSAISNTLESSIEAHDPGYKIVHFSPTPKMSTYLLAFIVGEFESVETKTKNGVKIRVFTTPGKTKHGKFALDVARRSLEYMDEYFAIPYPLPVLDLIAIPDFASGAMENWGAVTFRETALLIDEKNSPFINKERVAEVVAHELVHQWFGNLVTMEWWTHLWLNESFATYMAYKTIDHIFPQWQVMTKFVLNEYTHGLALDSLENTHPIEVPVNHPSEIRQIFDAISYSKGASVLRMLENYIGPEAFRDGLRFYLKKHSYKNTSSVHLWEAFEKTAKKPVRKIMAAWTEKPGYPVVSVTAKDNKLTLSQQRFQLLPSKDKTTWPIPMQAQIAKDRVSDVYLIQGSIAKIEINENKEFIKLNAGEHGFYRASYDPSTLASILIAATNDQLSIIDRIGLINDLGELAKAGYTSTDVFLEAFSHLAEKEDSYVVWSEMSSTLVEINNLLRSVGEGESMAKFIRPYYSKLVKHLGWEVRSKETTAHSLLRAVAIRQAGYFNDASVIKKANQLFAGHIKGKLVHPDMRLAVYAVVANHGSVKQWQQLKDLYSKAEMDEERNRLGYALTMFRNPKLIEKTVKFIFSDDVRDQDRPIFMAIGMGNPDARPLFWTAIKENWNDIMNRFNGMGLINHIVRGTRHFCTPKELAEVKQFFKTHKHNGGEQAVRQAIEGITINANWLKRDLPAIRRYLKLANK